ncbi:MAG: hypothetical protein IJG38_08605 [Thermoguttaceae bacterium]|nr:hypothetical protein [Thermoguttaceae bacterium]
MPRKRIFLRRATILHAGSLFLMLIVFIFLSVHLANRSLEELVPSGGQATTTQNGETVSKELNAAQAMQIAKIIDSAPYENLQNKTELAKIELKYVKAAHDTFTVTPSGVISRRGWYNQRKLDADQVEQILKIAFPKTEEETGNN